VLQATTQSTHATTELQKINYLDWKNCCPDQN